jgi:hypothetical protein
MGVKRQERESDHSPPSIAEVKECVELYFNSPNTPSWRRAQAKAKGQLYFYLHIFNVDETGSRLHNTPRKVPAKKRAKDVHIFTSSESGERA